MGTLVKKYPKSTQAKHRSLVSWGYWSLLLGLTLFGVSCGKFNATSSSTSTTSTTGAVAADAARLTWSAPTLNQDLTSLTDLGGYKVYLGTVPGVYSQTVDAGNVLTYTFSGLAAGTYYFTVKAYDTTGNLSTAATESSKVIK